MIERSEESPPPRRAPDLAHALRDAFLQEVGLKGAPEGARILGHYLLLEPIGHGGSGTVWRALHRELLHEVAVKLVDPKENDATDRLERFRREAATAARLHHPGIVAVHDFGCEDGAHYLAMELVEGRPLDRWLDEEKPDLDRRLAVLERVARAAQHAHEQGVVHRDLKPANVVVRALDAPVIIDFGVARARDDVHLTRDGSVVGTIAFMAPEQLRGERDIDVRADVWALGMLLHFLVTGELPFPIVDSPADALHARLTRPPMPSRINSSLPRALDVLVQRSLEPDVALRLASAGALADDLARLRRGEPIFAGATTLTQRLWRRLRARPLQFALGVAAAILLALGARLLLHSSRQERELAATRGSLDEKSRVLRIQEALLELAPRLKPLFARAERARYAPLPEKETAAQLAEIDGVLGSSGDTTGVRDAYRAWSLFLLRPELAAAVFESAKENHPENPFVWLLAGRRELRRCADTPSWSPTLPVSYELLVEPLGTLRQLRSHPAAEAVVASARDDLERAHAALTSGGIPSLDWALRLYDGFERFAANDAKGVIERLMPLASNDEIDLEATLLLCFALCVEKRVPEAVSHARRLHEAHPGVAPASKLLALCLQVAARDRLELGEAPIDALTEAQSVLADVKGGSLVDDILAAQIDFDLEFARLATNRSTIAAWDLIIARWIDLRDRTLATAADARARGAAHARVGWARLDAAILQMPHAGAIQPLRAAAQDYVAAAGLATESYWVGEQLVRARAMTQDVMARLELPVQPAEVDAAMKDVEHLRSISNATANKIDRGLSEADLGEAKLVFCRTIAGDADDRARAEAYDRAAALAHAAVTRSPQLGVALSVELECRLQALLARSAPIESLRAWAALLIDEILANGGDFDVRWVHPLLGAAFAKERADRIDVARLAAQISARCARVLPDDPTCETLVVQSELALRFIDAGHAAEHVDAALTAADAFLGGHAADDEAALGRALALSALADLGGRDDLDEAACLDGIRDTIAKRLGDDGDARALLLDLWLARRDDDPERAEQVAARIRARMAADPDAALAVRRQLRLTRPALGLPDAPKESLAAGRAWDDLGKSIGEER